MNTLEEYKTCLLEECNCDPVGDPRGELFRRKDGTVICIRNLHDMKIVCNSAAILRFVYHGIVDKPEDYISGDRMKEYKKILVEMDAIFLTGENISCGGHCFYAPHLHVAGCMRDMDYKNVEPTRAAIKRYLVNICIQQAGSSLQNTCHNLAAKSGWWDNLLPPNEGEVAKKLLLIHSEVSEATEGYRKGLMDDHLPHRRMVEVELADAAIRIFDLAGAMGLDLGGAIAEKLEYNQTREDHRPEVRNMEGGKRF